MRARSLFDVSIVKQAITDSFRKLTPRRQVRNPVMFVVELGSVLTTILFVWALLGHGAEPAISSARSRSSCGSPSCSATLPRLLPKVAGRRKRRPFDG
jgi:hypothetical protein